MMLVKKCKVRMRGQKVFTKTETLLTVWKQVDSWTFLETANCQSESVIVTLGILKMLCACAVQFQAVAHFTRNKAFTNCIWTFLWKSPSPKEEVSRNKCENNRQIWCNCAITTANWLVWSILVIQLSYDIYVLWV